MLTTIPHDVQDPTVYEHKTFKYDNVVLTLASHREHHIRYLYNEYRRGYRIDGVFNMFEVAALLAKSQRHMIPNQRTKCRSHHPVPDKFHDKYRHRASDKTRRHVLNFEQ